MGCRAGKTNSSGYPYRRKRHASGAENSSCRQTTLSRENTGNSVVPHDQTRKRKVTSEAQRVGSLAPANLTKTKRKADGHKKGRRSALFRYDDGFIQPLRRPATDPQGDQPARHTPSAHCRQDGSRNGGCADNRPDATNNAGRAQGTASASSNDRAGG